MLARIRNPCSRPTLWRSRTRCLTLQCMPKATMERSPVQLLGWATSMNLLYQHLPVEVQQHPQHGRSLVATEDIEADTVILSVCTDKVFMSQAAGELQMHWAAEMALRLLKERHVCNNSSSSSNNHSDFWKPWIDSLPQRVITPVAFTSEEVEQLVIPTTVQAVLNMQECLEGCYSELQEELSQIGCGWHDFLWAVQVLHSRCFYDATSQRHLAVPGIDMANHSSSSPNAAVRMLHSPAACQGLSALEEVAPALAQAVNKSHFQLLAGPDGIKAGEQVCISYGQWPTEPFLLLFGFVPQPNPHESLTIFSSLQHMANCFAQCLAEKITVVKQAARNGNNKSSVDHAAIASSQELAADQHFLKVFRQQVLVKQQQSTEIDSSAGSSRGPTGFEDLIVNPSGVDARLEIALECIHQAVEHAVVLTLQQCTHEGRQAGDISSSSSSQVNVSATVKAMQLPLGTVLQYRLLQLHGELQQSCLVMKQQHQHYTTEVLHEAIDLSCDVGANCADELYLGSSEHAGLVVEYCSSKAALAWQLAMQYS